MVHPSVFIIYLPFFVMVQSQSSISSPVSATTATTTSTSTSSSPVPTVPLYGQCGGLTYPGPRVCAQGTVCVYENAYFSNCFTQCGGMGYTGPTTCETGETCQYDTHNEVDYCY